MQIGLGTCTKRPGHLYQKPTFSHPLHIVLLPWQLIIIFTLKLMTCRTLIKNFRHLCQLEYDLEKLRWSPAVCGIGKEREKPGLPLLLLGESPSLPPPHSHWTVGTPSSLLSISQISLLFRKVGIHCTTQPIPPACHVTAAVTVCKVTWSAACSHTVCNVQSYCEVLLWRRNWPCVCGSVREITLVSCLWDELVLTAHKVLEVYSVHCLHIPVFCACIPVFYTCITL